MYCAGAFLNFTAFAYSIFGICLKNIRTKAAEFFGTKFKRFAWLSFKTAVLTLAALIFTAAVKTYFFQKIMASEMLKLMGGDVTVSRVELGLSNFSHDSVVIRGLSHSSQSVQLNVGKIDVTYDFIESMKERAKIQILTFKKPSVRVGDFKGVLNALFDGKTAGVKNYDFLLKLPKISVVKGELDFADGAWSIGELNCEITPLTETGAYYVRPWHLFMPASCGGEARYSTADKGRQVVEASAAGLAQFLLALSAAEGSEQFPY